MKHLALVLMAFPAIAFAFDWERDAPRFDYQGYAQLQSNSLSIGSCYALTWHGAGIELEHEEGDPLESFTAALAGGSALEYDLYRIKGVYRLPLSKHWNCRFSAGYGGGTGTAHFGTGLVPLVIALGLGFDWDGANYSYSEHVTTGSVKASLEANFFKIFKAELLGGITYYSFTDGIKQIRPVANWTPTLAFSLGVHTPCGR